MKKIILCLSFIMLLSISYKSNVSAESNDYYAQRDTTVEIELLEDGCIIETIIEEDVSHSRARASTKTGTKTVNYKNGSTTLWSVSVKGTFTYNGSTASCTSSVASANSYSSYWKILNKSSSRSGNTATGNATGKRYTAGVVVQTISREVKLSCSKNGDLS